MISNIYVKNFQSLKSVNLNLSKFTVVVGNSSCGKSSLVRALQALASNIRGLNCISIGETSTVISAMSEEWKVTLEKSENNSSYKIYDGAKVEEREYTKLGGAVPPEVTKVLKIKPLTSNGSLNFSNQDDLPYLLSDSGQAVARELGELTQVSVIFEAVREANRQRLENSRKLKIREQDLNILNSKLVKFNNLSRRIRALKEAEILYAKLETVIHKMELLKIVESSASDMKVIEFKQVPNLSAIDNLERKLKTIKDLEESVLRASGNMSGYTRCGLEFATEIENKEEEIHNILVDIGRCPLCEQYID